MLKIGDYELEFIEHPKGVFVKFYSVYCSHKTIIWARLKKGSVKEVSEYTISFTEPLLTHEFTFLKLYSNFLKVLYKPKYLHVFGFESEIGVITLDHKMELNAKFEEFC